MPYLDKLEDIAARAPKVGVTVAWVGHDDDCPKLRGGQCRCEPTIELITPEEYSRRLKAK